MKVLLPRQNALISFFDAGEFERVAVKMRFYWQFKLNKVGSKTNGFRTD